MTSYSTRTRHSLLESVTLSLPGRYVHLCTHFPAHPSLPQHAPSCASFLSRAAQRRPGPVSSLGINGGARPRSKVASKKKLVNYNCRARKSERATFGGISALLWRMRWQVMSSSMVEKRDNASSSWLPVESALKGVKGEGPGAHPGSRRTRPVSTPGPIITGPRTSACPGISRSGRPLCPVASANQSCQ